MISNPERAFHQKEISEVRDPRLWQNQFSVSQKIFQRQFVKDLLGKDSFEFSASFESPGRRQVQETVETLERAALLSIFALAKARAACRYPR
ncbi:MAG: hypothetical protein M3Q86_06545 [Verrucomicrobiota bacterium]|nr:hypothetical protein [Verrucomicrobiota bacterium]